MEINVHNDDANKNYKARLIIKGQWLYDNILPKTVQIFAINYDFFFDLDEGYNDKNETPLLNEQGEQYIIWWHDNPFYSVHEFPSVGGLSLQQAIEAAESIVQQKIKWDLTVTKDYV